MDGLEQDAYLALTDLVRLISSGKAGRLVVEGWPDDGTPHGKYAVRVLEERSYKPVGRAV